MAPLHALDNGLNQLPLLWKAIGLVGLPTVLCFILIGKDLALRFGWVEDVQIQQTQELIKAHAQIMNHTVANNQLLIQNQQYIQRFGRRAEGLSLAICLNTAKTELARIRCEESGKIKE